MIIKKDTKPSKILLLISFCPYIYIICYCLYYSIVGVDIGIIEQDTIYGAEAFFNTLFEDCWIDNVLDFNILGLIIVCCIIYQIGYFINNYKSKHKLNIKFILYIISIACWILYALSGIYAFFFGYSVGIIETHKVYWGEALINSLLMNLIGFSIIPVLPISLIYILFYRFKIKDKVDHNS